MSTLFNTSMQDFDACMRFSGAEAIVPGTPFARNSRGIYVGVAGNVQVIHSCGDTVQYLGVPAGTILVAIASQVTIANTTATNLVALYS